MQTLKLAGYRNIFAVASSRHHEYLRTIGAASTFDYTKADVSEQIEKAAGGKLKYVFDTISDEEHSLKPIVKVVGTGSKVAFLYPIRTGGHGSVSSVSNELTLPFPGGVEILGINTFQYQKVSFDYFNRIRNIVTYAKQNETFRKELQSKIIPKLLTEGLIKPNKVREVEGTTLLERATKGFDILRKGVSGERIVIKISEA